VKKRFTHVAFPIIVPTFNRTYGLTIMKKLTSPLSNFLVLDVSKEKERKKGKRDKESNHKRENLCEI